MANGSDFVSIIIVNYNGIDFIKDCIDSVFALDYPHYEVIVVDNGSTDDSLNFIRKKYRKIRIFLNTKNNFCAANNIGIKNAKGKYVTLLNNDTKADKNWLKELVKKIKEKKCAAVQSKVLFMDGKINSAGIIELPNFYVDNLGYMEEDKGQYDYDRELFAPYNASALYDKEKIIAVGLFDEDFEHYVDETDMAYRLKQKKDKIFFAYKSIVYHKYQGTFSGMQNRFTYYTERNRLFFVAKYFPEKLSDAFTTSHLFYKDIFFNHPFLISLSIEAINILLKHNSVEESVSVIKQLIQKIGDTLKLDNHDYKEKMSSLEKEIDNLRMAHEKEKMVLGREIDNLRMAHEKEKQVDLKEISNLRRVIFEFYNSKGYKYILKPIDRFYKKLRYLK